MTDTETTTTETTTTEEEEENNEEEEETYENYDDYNYYSSYNAYDGYNYTTEAEEITDTGDPLEVMTPSETESSMISYSNDYDYDATVSNVQDEECDDNWKYKIRKWFWNSNLKINNRLNVSVYDKDDSAQRYYEGELNDFQLKNAIDKSKCYKLYNKDDLAIIEIKVNYLRSKDELAAIYVIMDQVNYLYAAEIICQIMFNNVAGFNNLEEATDEVIREWYQARLNKYSYYVLVYIHELVNFVFPTDADAYAYVHGNTLASLREELAQENGEFDEMWSVWFYMNLETIISDYMLDHYVNLQRRILLRLNSILALSSADTSTEEYQLFLARGLWADKTNSTDFLTGANSCSDILTFQKLFTACFESTPTSIWQCLNALASKKFTEYNMPFVPNNITKYNPDREIHKAFKVVLNMIYFVYGYMNNNGGEHIQSLEYLGNESYLSEGGKCYVMDEQTWNPLTYDQFSNYDAEAVAEAEYAAALAEAEANAVTETHYSRYNGYYTTTTVPEVNLEYTHDYTVDETVLALGDYNYLRYNWTTSAESFLLQEISSISVNLSENEQYYFLQANGVLTTDDYIDQCVEEYKAESLTLYGVANQDYWSYADYLTYLHSGRTIRTQHFINFVYNCVIKKIAYWHITVPYNNMLTFDYVNYQHLGKKRATKKVFYKTGDAYTLPQYMYMDNDITTKKKPKKTAFDRTTVSRPKLVKVATNEIEYTNNGCYKNTSSNTSATYSEIKEDTYIEGTQATGTTTLEGNTDDPDACSVA